MPCPPYPIHRHPPHRHCHPTGTNRWRCVATEWCDGGPYPPPAAAAAAAPPLHPLAHVWGQTMGLEMDDRNPAAMDPQTHATHQGRWHGIEVAQQDRLNLQGRSVQAVHQVHPHTHTHTLPSSANIQYIVRRKKNRERERERASEKKNTHTKKHNNTKACIQQLPVNCE